MTPPPSTEDGVAARLPGISWNREGTQGSRSAAGPTGLGFDVATRIDTLIQHFRG